MIKDLAVDDTSIYFIRDALLSMPKVGGPVTPLPSDLWTFGNRIAIDRDAFYYRCARLGCGSALLRQPRSGGPPTAIADAHPVPHDVIVDDTSLYWISEAEQFLGGTKIMKVAKTGGAPVELARVEDRAQLAAPYVPPWTVAGGFVYLALDGLSDQDRIVRVPVDGGAAETVVEDEVSGRLLVADQFLVYPTVDGIRRVSLAGDHPGEPETWAPVVGYASGEAVAGGRLYWVDGDSLYTRAAPDTRTIRVARILDDRSFPRQPLSIRLGTVDDEHAYVHDTLGRIMAAPLAVPGPDVTLMADVGEEPGSLIVDANGVLATQRYQAGRSGRVLAIGETAWSVKVADPRALALAGDDVYWLDNADVMRAPRHGGPAALVASSGTGTTLAVDADHVYWFVERELLRVRRRATANDPPWANEDDVDRVARIPGEPYLLALSTDSIYMFSCLAGADGSYPNRYPLKTCRRAALYRQAKSGGAPLELTRTTATPMALAAGDDGVFYTERDGMRGRVVKISPDGKAVVIAADQVSPGPLTLTGAEVLWASRADWDTGPDPAPLEDLAKQDPRIGIWRAPRAGGAAVLVASVRDLPGLDPVALACDPAATTVYWLDASGLLSRAPLR